MYDIFQWKGTFSTLSIGIMALPELGRFFSPILYITLKGGKKKEKSKGRERANLRISLAVKDFGSIKAFLINNF